MPALILLFFTFFSPALEVYQSTKKDAFPVGSYIEARSLFQAKAKELKRRHPGAEVGQYKISSPTDNDLTTDYIFIPGKNSKKLFILTSGVHGAEGLTGSSLQIALLDKYIKNKETPPVNTLLVHAINPYGFKYFRRTNENNVDLNRNFARAEDFKSENLEYQKLKPLIEPDYTASGSIISRIGFFAKIAYVNLRRGRKFILGALRGQYKSSHGIFYGGSEPQPETKSAQKLIKRFANGASIIFHIDLHTGFGKKRHLHFFGNDNSASEQQQEMMQKVFADYRIETGNDKDFYSVTGDFGDWLSREYPKKQVLPMSFEFGTMNSQTLMGGLKSLWITVLENQGKHQGYLSPDDAKMAKIGFERLFNPQSTEWQSAALTRGAEALDNTLTKFSNL